MALGTNLSSDIQTLLSTAQPSTQASADAFAAAYYSYTSSALFGASVPVILTAMRDAMAATLATGLASPGLAATAAAAYATAVNTYWTGVTVAGGSGAGVTTGCPGAAGLTASLSAVFANLANTYAIAASGIAGALQTVTLTTICNLTLPPAGPVPTPIS